MKTPVSPHMVVALILSTIATLSAQNSANTTHASEISENAEVIAAKPKRSFAEGSSLVSPSVMQAVATARRALAEGKPTYSTPDAVTHRKVAVSTGRQPYEIEANSLQAGLVRMATISRDAAKRVENTEGADCKSIALTVGERIKLDVSKLLEIVESEVGANPSCACEIVKMSITASNADVAQLVSIVEVAITAAPDSMRIISQCAIATVPEAIAEVQALLAALDPNTGDGEGHSSKSAKSAKGAKDAEVASMVAPAMENPLDRPYFPMFIPTVIVPQLVTNVNP